jgi:hypothetical protein
MHDPQQFRFQVCIEGKIMSGQTNTFTVSVKAQTTPPLVVKDAAGNELADGESVALPDETVGTLVNDVVANVSGGKPPYTFSIAAGAVPSGTDLNSTTEADGSETVSIEGTPDTAEDASFDLAIADSSTPAKTAKVKAKNKIK